MATQTAEARRETNRKYYEKTKDVQNVKRKEWRKRFDEWYRSLKDGPCTDCGDKFHFSVMQFDHIDDDKLACVGRLVQSGNRQKLLDEIEKCELVCANCHAFRTWSRKVSKC